MDKLSSLIKEAKPLYRQRKRQKAIAKLVLCMTTPVILFTSVYQLNLQGNDIYVALDNNSLQAELMEDEYGLFKVK